MNHLAAIKNQLIQFYLTQRSKTEQLCQPLAIEDYVIQTSDEVSPPKWHLAHTSWFFETFVLIPYSKKYQLFDSLFQHLFNSYYHQIGNPFPRIRRGSMSRPTVKTIYSYRKYVDEHIINLIEIIPENQYQKIEELITLGLHHEQQHQELLLMDIKHNFSIHLDYPVYHHRESHKAVKHIAKFEWINVVSDIVEIGHHGNDFCYDNELPRHTVILKPYSISSRLVSNAEYCEFIDAGGYENAKWWLSDGWDCVQKNRWKSPLYWQYIDNKWYIFTLNGLQELNPSEPVCHLSYYEAEAYARWKGFRLPTETEWEHFSIIQNLNPIKGNFLESNFFHPQTIHADQIPAQIFGDVWEWTGSSYCPYPGYKPIEGALGEYNGKFMSNQIVLRGGSCITPKSHIRHTYRNFFQPDKRWQFSGIRLANNNE